jgi:hypothetical protein
MAATKPKKSNTKVFDVAKPGKSEPTATSKPVIVTHRPVLQDPMVVNIEVKDNEVRPLASPSEVRRKVQISPLHDVDGNDIVPGAPEVVKTKEAKVDSDSANDLVLNLPPEITGEKPQAATANEDVTSAPEVPAEIVETRDKPAKPTEETNSEPEALDPTESESEKDKDKETKLEEVETKETPDDPPSDFSATTNSVESESLAEPSVKANDDTSEFGLMPEPAVGDEGGVNPDAAKQKADEEAQKLADEQAKIIDSGVYYLPIDAVAHRRAARQTMIGLVLVLLFGALLFLAALDAEIITINGLPAPTDYL